MAGFLQRGLLLYFFLAVAVVFSAPDVIFDGGSPAENTVLSWFDVSYNNATGVTTIGSGFNDATVGNTTDSMNTISKISESGGILGWLDPLLQVFSWIPLIFKILFSPILLLTDPRIAMPTIALLLIGVPLVLMMIIGIIGFIRSGIL